MSNLVRKEIHGIFRTRNPIKDQIRKYKRREKELDPNSTATFVYVRGDLLSRIINCRGEKTRGEKKKKKKKIDNFRCKLGFTLHDIIISKESVTIKIINTFLYEKNTTTVLDYQIDLYFLEHKLAVEVDEKGHTDRDEKKKKENESEEQIKKELGCIFIRINPDAENYIFI